jgi:hypothetical protein
MALILLNTVLLLLLIEIASRGTLAVLARRGDPSGLVPGEDAIARLRAAYPGRADPEIIALRSAMEHRLVYEPWVQFRMPDRSGDFVNVQGLCRRSDPAVVRGTAIGGEGAPVGGAGSGNAARGHAVAGNETGVGIQTRVGIAAGVGVALPETTVTVAFLGGSTMFGFNVADDQTIASCFARQGPAHLRPNQRLVVRNLGQPYYYSAQEAIALAAMLLRGERPTVVVFLDGLNDVIQPLSSYRQVPFWTFKLQDLMQQEASCSASRLWSMLGCTSTYGLLARMGVVQWGGPAGQAKRWEAGYAMPEGIDLERVATAIAENYLRAAELARTLARGYGVRCWFFWQPVPYVGYDRSADPLCDQRDLPLFGRVYALVRQRLPEHGDMRDLSDLTGKEVALPFVDAVHYSPALNARLAQRMWEVVGER